MRGEFIYGAALSGVCRSDIHMEHLQGIARSFPTAVRETIEFMAEGIGARPAGSEAERRAADFILRRFRAIGCRTAVQEFAVEGGSSRNILAEKGDPGAGGLFLVVGAHYDTVPDSPGANDNASGVAVVLEVARVLADTRLPRRTVFAAFGAEEGAHAGSKHFVSVLNFPSDVCGMVNLDAVGVAGNFELAPYGGIDPWLADHCRETARRLGVRTCEGTFRGKGDYVSFTDAGIPVACFARTDHPAAHTPGDDMSIIAPERVAEIGEVLVAALLSLPAL